MVGQQRRCSGGWGLKLGFGIQDFEGLVRYKGLLWKEGTGTWGQRRVKGFRGCVVGRLGGLISDKLS